MFLSVVYLTVIVLLVNCQQRQRRRNMFPPAPRHDGAELIRPNQNLPQLKQIMNDVQDKLKMGRHLLAEMNQDTFYDDPAKHLEALYSEFIAGTSASPASPASLAYTVYPVYPASPVPLVYPAYPASPASLAYPASRDVEQQWGGTSSKMPSWQLNPPPEAVPWGHGVQQTSSPAESVPPSPPDDPPWIHVTSIPLIPAKPDAFYEDMMEEMSRTAAGYLSVAFSNLCAQMALKEPRHREKVVRHAEGVVKDMIPDGRLRWLGEPMGPILLHIVHRLSVMTMELLESYTIMLRFTTQHRRHSFSPEVNEVIDLADRLVGDLDGRQLLGAVREFRQFPNVTITAYELATALLEAFEAPFRAPSSERDRLMSAANDVLRVRFPAKKWFTSIVREGVNMSRARSRRTPRGTRSTTETVHQTYAASAGTARGAMLHHDYIDDKFVEYANRPLTSVYRRHLDRLDQQLYNLF
ncbi:uncharacterized protein LOC142986351 [Anticarsia gemmatalis]|uniref:uncharacterized protein LOC142986351 n=1 Tax=Anticarsia gemmatalis TaxID=129554 RepID=UPI003F771DDE